MIGQYVPVDVSCIPGVFNTSHWMAQHAPSIVVGRARNPHPGRRLSPVSVA